MVEKQECDFGMLFHTALRKSSETDWSVVLWNYIHSLGKLDDDRGKRERTWPHFCDSCQKLWEQGYKPSEAARYWATMWNNEAVLDIPQEERPPLTGESITFQHMLKMCDDETLQDIDRFVEFRLEQS